MKKIHYIYIHGTDTDNNLHLNVLKGAFYLDKIENGSYYDLKRDYFYFINRNICEMKYYYNFYYLNWSGILSETERLFVADKLANDLKKNEFAKYKKIVLIGHSYGGSIAINASYSAIKNNLNKKIEIVTIQSPILNNQIRKIDYLLNEKGSKMISIHSPSDYTAVYDPINFGEGVNDFNYENKFPNNKNLASFMNWKINDFGEIQELNHIGPKYSMNLIKFISNILNNFDQYGGNKTVLLV
jgi:hypothetical protein